MTYRVVVKGGGQYKEADAIEAITPGHLVALNSSDQAIKQTAVGTPPSVRVALEQTWVGKDRDTAYASGDRVLYQYLDDGDEFYGLLAAGAAAVVKNDYLESAGDGTVRKATAGGARATVTIGSGNGALTVTSRASGSQGNGISIQIAAASGGGSVAVTNDDILVTPAAAGDTATAVVAQIAANAVANAMVTATAGGTGASPVGTTAATNLAGGVDGGAGTSKLQAREAVDNSAGVTQARIRVEVIS